MEADVVHPGQDSIARILKALGNGVRIQILDSIEAGVANPGEIAKKLGRHRSVIERHLRVLVRAAIVEKVPALGRHGNLTIRYRTREGPKEIPAVARRIAENP